MMISSTHFGGQYKITRREALELRSSLCASRLHPRIVEHMTYRPAEGDQVIVCCYPSDEIIVEPELASVLHGRRISTVKLQARDNVGAYALTTLH